MRRHELTTFDFALLLLAGLAVFTAIVSVVSYFRSPPPSVVVVAASGPPTRPDHAGMIEGRGEAMRIDREAMESATPIPRPEPLLPFDVKPASTEDLFPDVPKTLFPSEQRVYYDKQTGRPILNAKNNEQLFPQAKGWLQKLQNAMWTRRIRYHTEPDKISNMLQSSGSRMLAKLNNVERRLHREPDGRIRIDYNSQLDESVLVTMANYLAHLKIWGHMVEDKVPGMPDCAAGMPTIEAMTTIPKLPTFDPKLRGGEDETKPDYVLDPFVAGDPYATIVKMRDHVAAVVRCAQLAKNLEGVEYRIGLVDVTAPFGLVRSKDPLTPDTWVLPEKPPSEGVYGAMRPGAMSREGVYGAASPTGEDRDGVWRALTPGERGEGVFGQLEPELRKAESGQDGVYTAMRPSEMWPEGPTTEGPGSGRRAAGGGPLVSIRPENPTGEFLHPVFVATRETPKGVFGPLTTEEMKKQLDQAAEKKTPAPAATPVPGDSKPPVPVSTVTTTSTTTTKKPTTTTTTTSTIAPKSTTSTTIAP
ncbi:MAG: hypothetical protein IT350_19760 [Deltaproteobacteria bacterium]|nr:hypothetical protein [Deltaproteobacteria bacterium]